MLPCRLTMLITQRRAQTCLSLFHEEKDAFEEGKLYRHRSICPINELFTITVTAEKALGLGVRDATIKLEEHRCTDSQDRETAKSRHSN